VETCARRDLEVDLGKAQASSIGAVGGVVECVVAVAQVDDDDLAVLFEGAHRHEHAAVVVQYIGSGRRLRFDAGPRRVIEARRDLQLL
jgi:hypothetical protein